MNKNKATMIGMLAVLFWSAVVGLIRSVSEHLGAIGGAAVMYSLATVLLFFTSGWPKLKDFSRGYLLWGSVFFVGTELCLSLSIGYAQNGRQAIEVGMVNYLWPTFTIIAAILFNKQYARWWVVPGFILSFAGIAWVLGGEKGLDWDGIVNNVKMNPLSYMLAFCDALLWAGYCTVTAKLTGKSNGVTFFFMLVSLVLWIKYSLFSQDTLEFSWISTLYAVAAASCLGLGYAVWNIGIMYGNMTLLAGASYFIPIFSALVSAILLNTPLSNEFWQGAATVCVGSMICWMATRAKKQSVE